MNPKFTHRFALGSRERIAGHVPSVVCGAVGVAGRLPQVVDRMLSLKFTCQAVDSRVVQSHASCKWAGVRRSTFKVMVCEESRLSSYQSLGTTIIIHVAQSITAAATKTKHITYNYSAYEGKCPFIVFPNTRGLLYPRTEK